MTVIEVAFISPSGYIDSLFIVNRCIDAIFTFDVALQFVLMYPHQGSSPQDTVRWIHEPELIAKNYLRTWFTIDIVSIGVSGLDFLSVKSIAGEQDGGLASFKVFRVIRVARLIKLVRLVRSSRIMKRLESRVAINYGYLALAKCLIMLLLAGHWYACLWGLITTFESPKDTWYTEFGYCSYDVDLSSNPKANVSAEEITMLASLGNATDELLDKYAWQLDDENNYVCKSVQERYTASLYWAIMT